MTNSNDLFDFDRDQALLDKGFLTEEQIAKQKEKGKKKKKKEKKEEPKETPEERAVRIAEETAILEATLKEKGDPFKDWPEEMLPKKAKQELTRGERVAQKIRGVYKSKEEQTEEIKETLKTSPPFEGFPEKQEPLDTDDETSVQSSGRKSTNEEREIEQHKSKQAPNWNLYNPRERIDAPVKMLDKAEARTRESDEWQKFEQGILYLNQKWNELAHVGVDPAWDSGFARLIARFENSVVKEVEELFRSTIKELMNE